MPMFNNAAQIASIGFAPAAGAANVCDVVMTVKDKAGRTIKGPHELDIWLSDAATGLGITGTTASGTVTAKSASGTVLTALTAKKHIRAQTLATGLFTLEITDTAKTTFYVCAKIDGLPVQVSAILATGNYG